MKFLIENDDEFLIRIEDMLYIHCKDGNCDVCYGWDELTETEETVTILNICREFTPAYLHRILKGRGHNEKIYKCSSLVEAECGHRHDVAAVGHTAESIQE